MEGVYHYYMLQRRQIRMKERLHADPVNPKGKKQSRKYKHVMA